MNSQLRWSALAIGIVLLSSGCTRSAEAKKAIRARQSIAAVALPSSADAMEEEVVQTVGLLGGRVLRNEQGIVHSVLLTDLPVTDTALVSLNQLPGLEVLSLSGTRVTNSGMAHLTNLERLTYLFMNDTEVSDEGLLALADSTAIRYISLDNSPVSPQAVDQFRKLSPGTVVQYSSVNSDQEGVLPPRGYREGDELPANLDGDARLEARIIAGTSQNPRNQFSSANSEDQPTSTVKLRYHKSPTTKPNGDEN